MKHNIFRILVLLLCLAACQKEYKTGEMGFLGVEVSIDDTEFVITKAGEIPVLSLEITDQAGQSVARYDDYTEILGEQLSLPGGKYKIVIKSENYGTVAWNQDTYYGENDINIVPFVLNRIDVTVKRGDFKVALELPEGFREKFPTFTFTAKNYREPEQLVFTYEPDPENPLQGHIEDIASFPVSGKFNWNIKAVNSNGLSISKSSLPTIQGVEPGFRYNVKITIADEPDWADGKGGFNVYINGEMVDFEENIGVDLTPGTMPTLSQNFTVEGGMIQIGDETARTFTASAKLGISSLCLKSNVQKFVETFGSEIELVNASASTIESLKNAGISVPAFAEGSKDSQQIDITGFVMSLPTGSYDFGITITDAHGRYVAKTLRFEIVDGALASISVLDGWACFINAKARIYSDDVPEGLSIQYKKASDSEWNTVPVTADRIDGKYCSLRIDSLEPETTYEVRTFTTQDGADSKVLSFTTEKAEIIPYMNFDEWYRSGEKIWYPNAEGGVHVWDSANPGAASVAKKIPTVPEETDVVKGKAAKLETTTAMGMLAAGNVYLGKFGGLAGLGASLDWGYAYSSRPLALRGYYKYAPVAIDKTKAPYTDLKGQMDQCSIMAFVTDWKAPFNINTSTSTFVDYANDSNIIAFGDLYSGSTDGEYIRFTIPLTYRALDRIPNYIVIACAASRYGDYFTGGVGSVLLLDEFELVYDPAQLTAEEYAKVFENF